MRKKTDSNFNEVNTRLQNLENWVHSLRGSDLEKTAPHRIRSHLYTKMKLQDSSILLSLLHEVNRTLMSALQKAGNSGQLTQEECSRVFNTDLIMKAFTADGKEVWVAFEISALIEDNDIERALESADILRRLMGIQAVAAVGGYTISDPQAERAKNSGVEVFIFKSA